MDFNSAKKHVPQNNLIPKSTNVPVQLTLRPGGAGEGGWLKRNRDGTCMMLDCEFTVVEGDFARRKFWTMLVIEGETDGQKQAAEISGSLIRAMLESARGINPSDESGPALEGRKISSWQDLDGMRFWAVVGIRKQEGYDDKNTLAAVTTPDRKGWTKLDQDGRPASQGTLVTAPAAKATSASRPSWAA